MPQASANFTYDSRNMLSSINRLNGVSSALTYDSAGQLLKLTHAKGASIIDAEHYDYDAVGNRSVRTTNIAQPLNTPPVTSQFDAANRLVRFGSMLNSYDANGNLIQEGTTIYTWDSRNRLKSVVTAAGQRTNFAYDFAGNLIAQADSGPSLNLTKYFCSGRRNECGLRSRE